MMEHCPRSVLILHRHTYTGPFYATILRAEWSDLCQGSERCPCGGHWHVSGRGREGVQEWARNGQGREGVGWFKQ